MKKNGFTLIEIILVIALLATVFTLVVPKVADIVKNNKIKANAISVGELANYAKTNYTQDYLNQDHTYIVNDGLFDGEVEIKTAKKFTGTGKVIFTSTGDVTYYVFKDGYCYFKKFGINSDYYKVDTSDDCGANNYVLAYELKKQYDSGNTVGLLKDDTGYFYKGKSEEVSNNFVWWAGILWRVISIDNKDNVTMISSGPLASISPAVSVWTNKNEYNNSYINTWLNSTGADGVLYKSLKESDKAKIVDSTFNIGTVNEPTSLKTKQHFGLLDYIQYDKGGRYNSYLNIDDGFWFGNYSINGGRYGSNGEIISNFGYSPLAMPLSVRPVVTISNIVISDEGNGTFDNPYRQTSVIDNINDVKVGEYISVPYNGTTTKYCNSTDRCLFRVVSKDNDSVRITLNGILNNVVTYSEGNTYTSGNAIDTYVGAFASTISTTYRYTGNKEFYIGNYNFNNGSGTNYNVIKSSKLLSPYGLPVLGELFSRDNVADYFFYMNSFSSNDEDMEFTDSYESGVRPIIYLKNNLTFTGGDGTASNPYTLN